jgi:hypothetical protein
MQTVFHTPFTVTVRTLPDKPRLSYFPKWTLLRFQMFIHNSNSYSTQLHTDNTLTDLNNVVEFLSSNGIVKAIKLAYQEITMKLERNSVIRFVTYDITVYIYIYIYIYIYTEWSKLSVYLMITEQKATSTVQSVPGQIFLRVFIL